MSGRPAGVQPHHANRGVGLINSAEGRDAQPYFLPAFAGAKRGGAVVTGAGIDPIEDHHTIFPLAWPGPKTGIHFALGTMRYFPISQMVAMMMMIATNCSSTRRRIKRCEVLGDPPRIMLMRPSTSTTATAPIATGTR